MFKIQINDYQKNELNLLKTIIREKIIKIFNVRNKSYQWI